MIFIGKLVLHQMMAFSKHLKVPCTEHNVYHICGDEELKLEDRTLSHSPVLAMPATSESAVWLVLHASQKLKGALSWQRIVLRRKQAVVSSLCAQWLLPWTVVLLLTW